MKLELAPSIRRTIGNSSDKLAQNRGQGVRNSPGAVTQQPTPPAPPQRGRDEITLWIGGLPGTGGFYLCNTVHLTPQQWVAGVSGGALSSTAFCSINSSVTVELVNVAEIGNSLCFLPTHSFVRANRTGIVDPSSGLAVFELFREPPDTLRVDLHNASGGNATLSGTAWSTASFTYTMTYQGQTLGTNESPEYRPVAGEVTGPATAGFAARNVGAISGQEYTLRTADEQQPMTKCGT